jgi:hypothetical protein
MANLQSGHDRCTSHTFQLIVQYNQDGLPVSDFVSNNRYHQERPHFYVPTAVHCILFIRLHISSCCYTFQCLRTPPSERLRWSRGCVLASSTQVRGLKLGRSFRIFQGEKIPSTPSFGVEIKPAVSCRRFAACKRSLNVTWNSTSRQNSRLLLLAH